MKIFKTLLTVFAADVLSLFIGLTLAGSASTLVRIISAVCTTGILICLLGSFAVKSAQSDLKAKRSGKQPEFPFMPLLMGISASVPGIISWLTLKFSEIDFYRWHKLINGFFLQIYNFINPDASSAALTSEQIWIMLPLAFIPAFVFLGGYYLILIPENQK